MHAAPLLTLAALGAMAASPALAQPRYQPPPASQQDRYDDRPDPRNAQTSRGDAEGREPDLGRELSLRPDQQAALAAYKAAFAPDEARERREENEARRLPAMTTPQRLDFSRRQMEAERADFERTDAATRRFYAQLSPAQQRAFDRVTAPQMDDDDDDRAPSAGQPAPPRAPR